VNEEAARDVEKGSTRGYVRVSGTINYDNFKHDGGKGEWNDGERTMHSCTASADHDVSLDGLEMNFHMTQIFHRATGKTTVGRNLDQKCEVCPAGWELSGTCVDCDELLNSPGEVQTYDRKDTPKRRSAQVDHTIGNAKKELVHIRLVL